MAAELITWGVFCAGLIAGSVLTLIAIFTVKHEYEVKD